VVLSVEAVGQDLAFQPAMQSYRLRLRRPALRLPQALPSTPGIPVRLAVGQRRDTLWAVWNVADVRQTSIQVLSPSFGWSLLTPARYAYGREVHWITALWIAGWLAVIGYWSARARRGGLATLGSLVLLLSVGLGLLPQLMGYPAVHWTEWLAGIAGSGIGGAAHRSAAYFEE
jgi:hypothetical protein